MVDKLSKIDELTNILKRLDAGDDPTKVKEEARDFLSSIGPDELVVAEQKLMETDVEPERIRHLCSVHMEMLGGEHERMKANLEQGHVIHTMMSEHEVILGLLQELEEVNQTIQRMEALQDQGEVFEKLRHIAEHLIGAEPHHQREEIVLFPELERRGFFGPPQIMRMEHEELRAQKKELKELAEEAEKMNQDAKKKLDEAARFIISTLRDHIFKENSILYPTALQVIREEEVWSNLKAECDKIGYCCFTPSTDEEPDTLDLRSLPPFQRHERILQRWVALRAGDVFRIINDHDPKPLPYQFEAEYAGEFEWKYEKEGPTEWIVQIKRLR